MKLVTEFAAEDEAVSFATMLEQKGIATFLSNRRTHRVITYPRVMSDVGLWVILDSQLGDAVALLDNPNHVVREPLTATEIAKIKASAHSGNMNAVLSFLFKMLLAALLFAAAVALLYWPT